ncbi:hypothetical protein KBI5_09825 [Frankia sp. KB5]|nr:hypothetical protein KBI5_09825 [Frankia sp. KB5]
MSQADGIGRGREGCRIRGTRRTRTTRGTRDARTRSTRGIREGGQVAAGRRRGGPLDPVLHHPPAPGFRPARVEHLVTDQGQQVADSPHPTAAVEVHEQPGGGGHDRWSVRPDPRIHVDRGRLPVAGTLWFERDKQEPRAWLVGVPRARGGGA